jgi:hypothetical protein
LNADCIWPCQSGAAIALGAVILKVDRSLPVERVRSEQWCGRPDPHLARATSLHAGLTIAQLVVFGSLVVNFDHGHEAAVQAILALGWW